MIENELIVSEEEGTNKQKDKQQYVKPCLVSYGDVRDITLGNSSPFGESGAPTTRCDFCP